MKKIEDFIEFPGDKDIPVKQVFTEQMFSELETRMNQAGWGNVRSYWENDYQNRKIVSQFMKDGELGSKRLASMPDRITNTINVEGSNEPVCRPTVINMYSDDLGTLNKWWKKWVVSYIYFLFQFCCAYTVNANKYFYMQYPIFINRHSCLMMLLPSKLLRATFLKSRFKCYNLSRNQSILQLLR